MECANKDGFFASVGEKLCSYCKKGILPEQKITEIEMNTISMDKLKKALIMFNNTHCKRLSDLVDKLHYSVVEDLNETQIMKAQFEIRLKGVEIDLECVDKLKRSTICYIELWFSKNEGDLQIHTSNGERYKEFGYSNNILYGFKL